MNCTADVVLELNSGVDDFARCRRAVSAVMIEQGFSKQDVWDSVAAVVEGCANAILYGSPDHSPVTLRLLTFPDRFEAIIKDCGSGFPCPLPCVDMPAASSRCGRGIPLMKAFMDEVYFLFDGGCEVRLVKHLKTV